MKILIAVVFLISICTVAYAGWSGMKDDGGNTFWESDSGQKVACMTDDAGNVFCD